VPLYPIDIVSTLRDESLVLQQFRDQALVLRAGDLALREDLADHWDEDRVVGAQLADEKVEGLEAVVA
jgi:hypothetical protein